MPVHDRGILSPDIHPSTISLIWRAERSDLSLTPEAALARARQRLESRGAIITPLSPTAFCFQGPRGGRGGKGWNGLGGCKVEATRTGAAVVVRAGGSFAGFVAFGAIVAVVALIEGVPWFASLLPMGVLFTGLGLFASSRLKDVAQYALCMIPDDGAV